MAPKRPRDEGQESPARSKKKQKTADARVIRFQSGPSSGTGVVTNSEWLIAPSHEPGAMDSLKTRYDWTAQCN